VATSSDKVTSTSPVRKWAGRLWFPVAIVLLVGYVFRTVNPIIELDAPSTPAPVFERPTLQGAAFDLAAEKGRPVVVNFWATWCPPCRAEIPGFVDLQEEFGDDIIFVGVSLDEGGFDTVRPFADRHGVNYPLVMDRSRIFRAYGGRGTIPTTFLVDAEGNVRFAHEGIVTKRSLRPALRQLVEEASASTVD
jgi:thiol-disulfide isomerase/thioredoxin